MAKQISIFQFGGKLGTAVGFKNRHGEASVRQAATSYNNPNTLAQRTQRTKFLAVTNLANALPRLATIGLSNYAKSQRMSNRNALTRMCIKNNVLTFTASGSQLQYALDDTAAAKLQLSRGELTPVPAGAVRGDIPNSATIDFETPADINPATTKLVMVIQHIADGTFKAQTFDIPATSGDHEYSMATDPLYLGTTVRAWSYFMDFGSEDAKAYYEQIQGSSQSAQGGRGALSDIKQLESAAVYSRTTFHGHVNLG